MSYSIAYSERKYGASDRLYSAGLIVDGKLALFGGYSHTRAGALLKLSREIEYDGVDIEARLAAVDSAAEGLEE